MFLSFGAQPDKEHTNEAYVRPSLWTCNVGIISRERGG